MGLRTRARCGEVLSTWRPPIPSRFSTCAPNSTKSTLPWGHYTNKYALILFNTWKRTYTTIYFKRNISIIYIFGIWPYSNKYMHGSLEIHWRAIPIQATGKGWLFWKAHAKFIFLSSEGFFLQHRISACTERQKETYFQMLFIRNQMINFQLHAYFRRHLAGIYGNPSDITKGGPIPAHLFGKLPNHPNDQTC